MATLHHTLADRVVVTENGCAEWISPRLRQGYGRIKIAGKNILVHRLSYELSIGPIPEGLCVLHRCDNPPCCNPDHLFLGTNTDNIHDSMNKGRPRGPRGETNRHNKLTPKQVLKIRDDTRGLSEIGREYGISHTAVRLIKKRINWKHLP